MKDQLLIWQQLKESRKPLTPERRLQIIQRLKAQAHKPGVNPDDWYDVKPDLLLIAEFDLDLCQAYKLPVLYTSIIRPKISVSKTDIHAKKRAFDRSLHGWTDEQAASHAEMVNDAFDIGAISIATGKEREAVFENDEFDKDGKKTKTRHLHFQCRP